MRDEDNLAAALRYVSLNPARARFPDFSAFLDEEPDATMIERPRRAKSIGRPLGERRFLAAIERTTRRVLATARRGPKPPND